MSWNCLLSYVLKDLANSFAVPVLVLFSLISANLNADVIRNASECDLAAEEGSRRTGAIAGQPDHLALRATLLVKSNLGSILNHLAIKLEE